ncbi:MAG: adenylate/guanylate cyclase domain-containing protein [Gaiellaceae bacterium]
MTTCPNCGEENPERAKFCLECGASLEQAKPTVGEERKIVTVLFCDLVGFTARSDAVDPEDVRARIRPYHARLRTEIERFSGTVEKFIGDAVMAVFGAPVAHEDDPERAVRAGLRILEAIEDLNEREPGLELQVRIGVNTGEAVIALGARPEQGEGIATGDVVNTAARLQATAPVGALVVGEATYRQTREVFLYEPLDPVEVKGKAEPLLRRRALSARARFGEDVTRAPSTPLVGREHDLAVLQATYGKAVRESSVQLVTVVGEPGLGKSRLVAELFAFVDSRPEIVSWRQGRCLPYGEGISFWALGEIVKAQTGMLESDSPEDAAAKLEAALPAEEGDREWLKARLAPLVGIDAGVAASREESFTAWRRFLEAIASSRPAVFVLEDLHWAEEPLLAFLEHVVEWAQGVSMLLVCTARPELYERAPHWLAGARNTTRIGLAPLSEAETAQLVSVLLDQALLPAEVQALVLERAGGNPLYAEEFVRMLEDRELLVRKGRTLQLREGAEIPFPDSLQALIAARLDTLRQERKALLQDAAVVGKVFWAGALAAIGDRDEQAVSSALHELARAELIRPVRQSTMAGEAEYSFWHVLVRDVAYGQIPRIARAAKHEAAAGWIERQAPERIDDLAEVLAHHYLQARQLFLAGKPDEAARLDEPARRFLAIAGDRALSLDVAKAEAHYAQALALAPADHPERAGLLVQAAEAAGHAGRYAEAETLLQEAVAGFREQGDRRRTGDALARLAGVSFRMGGSVEELYADALELLESEPEGPELLEAYAGLAGHHFLGGRFEEAIAAAQRALALFRELGAPEPARALGYLGGARCGRGETAGVEDMRRALALALEQGLGREAAILYNNLGVVLWPVEGPAAALAIWQEGSAFADRRGIGELALAIACSSLPVRFELGDWGLVSDDAEQLAARAEAGRAHMPLLDARSTQARVLAYQGQLDQAAKLADRVLRAAREGGHQEALFIGLSLAALVEVGRQGGRERAAALLAELVQRARAGRSRRLRLSFSPNDAYYVAAVPELIRTALAASQPALAERMLEGVEPITPRHEYALLTAAALLAEHAGELEQAASLYAQAAEQWQRLGILTELAQALLGEGRCLFALGDPIAATKLESACELLRGLAARPLIAEANELLGRALALTS